MKTFVLVLLAVSLAVAAGLALLASGAPDGLEHSLASLGVAEGEALLAAPMADYQLPGESPARWRQIGAGLSGTLVVFFLAWLAGTLLRRRRPRSLPPAPAHSQSEH